MRAILLTIVLALSACNNSMNVDDARGLAERIGTALTGEDADRLGASFATDAVFLPAAGSALVGREAIVSHYRAHFEHLDYTVTLASEEVESSNDVAIQRGVIDGVVVLKAGGPSIPARGKFLKVSTCVATRIG
jgi:uncharacterized protein (TIGR02246 family)